MIFFEDELEVSEEYIPREMEKYIGNDGKAIIPNSYNVIHRKAFYLCKKLKSIVIPNSVMFIGDDAFDDCSKDLIITTSKGSYAEKYANENGIKVKLI